MATQLAARTDAYARVHSLIPPERLEAMLGKLADGLAELGECRGYAGLELHVQVVRGRFFEARWDRDERIG